MTFSAEEEITDIFLKTIYINKDILKHSLYVKGMVYIKKDIDWPSNAEIFLTNTDGSSVSLVIKNSTWGKHDNELIFFTNNPTNITSDSLNYMNFTRRLLSSSSFKNNYKIGISISENAMGQILPAYPHSGTINL